MTESSGASLSARERRGVVGGGAVALAGAAAALHRDGVGTALVTLAIGLGAVAFVLLVLRRALQ